MQRFLVLLMTTLMLSATLAGCLGGDEESSSSGDSDSDGDNNGTTSPTADTDGDGKFDIVDECPDTPANAAVNGFGCPDTDGDGLFDNEDDCAATPGIALHDGCPRPPTADDDNDGVLNENDQCPDAPAETSDGCPVQDADGDGVLDESDLCDGHDDSVDVDQDGIPDGCDGLVDNDDDGVANIFDLCEGHDDGIDVDQDGIPDGCDDSVDSDGDGVVDSSDNCPDTLAGITVDENGCELVVETVEVKIGLLSPQTGANSALAPGLENAAQMAIDDINAAQNAYSFSLAIADTESSETHARIAAWSIIDSNMDDQADVAGIIGGSSLNIIDGAMEKPRDFNIPVITPFVDAASLDEVEDDGLIWRVIPSEADSATAAAMWSNIYEMNNVGIIHIDDGFGRAYARTYTEAYGAENICATISYPSNTLDFEEPANEIVSAGCANAMIATHVSDGAMLIDALGDVGFIGSGPRVVVSHEIGYPEFPDSLQAKTRIQGMVGGNLGEWTSPLYPAFNSTYQTKFSEMPQSHSASTYDATMIMAKAIIQAGSVNGADVNAAIPTVGTEYAGIGGTIDFDSHGNTPGMNYDLFRFEASGAGENTETDFEEIGIWSLWNGIAASCRSNADSEVIGVLSPRTGIHSPYAEGEEQGVELGVELLNINVRNICFSMIVADTQSTQQGAATAMQTLVDAGVFGVIGPHSTEEALGAIPIADTEEIPIMGFGTFSNQALEEAWENAHPEIYDYGYFWRIGVGVDHQSAAAAAYISNQGYSNVAILHHNGLDATALSTSLQALLSSTCSVQSFTSGQTDFSTEVGALSGCDAVVIFAEVVEGAAILSEISSQSLTIAKIGGHGLGDTSLLSTVSDTSILEGLTGIRMGIDHDVAEYDHELKYVYNMNYGGDVPAYTSWSGDATIILGGAAGSSDAAGDITGARVNLLIPFYAENVGVSSGEITLDNQTGDTSHTNLDIYQWSGDGSFTEIGRWRLDLGLAMFEA